MVNNEAAVIIGASSALAQAVGEQLAKSGSSLVLLARSADKLAQLEAHYLALGAKAVTSIASEIADATKHEAVLQDIASQGVDASRYYVFYGVLPEQGQCESDAAMELRALDVNFLSVTSWLNRIAQRLADNGKGTIVVVSSVAGDRGRQSNYVYGAAKGGLSIYLQGLRNRLHASGVHVLTVKPGFIDTPMTAHLEKNLLWAQPERIAADIERAVVKQKEVVYTPWFWRYIMLVIRLIPEGVFKRLKL